MVSFLEGFQVCQADLMLDNIHFPHLQFFHGKSLVVLEQGLLHHFSIPFHPCSEPIKPQCLFYLYSSLPLVQGFSHGTPGWSILDWSDMVWDGNMHFLHKKLHLLSELFIWEACQSISDILHVLFLCPDLGGLNSESMTLVARMQYPICICFLRVISTCSAQPSGWFWRRGWPLCTSGRQ